MCGRFTQSLPLDWIEAWLGVDEVDAACVDLASPRYNIAPSQRVLVVVNSDRRRLLTFAEWGLRGGDAVAARPINARAETIDSHPRFREAFELGRCVVPASGFYEWQANAGSRRKQPWYFAPTAAAKPLLLLAAVFVRDTRGASCAILTTGADPIIAPVHDRMPMLLRAESVRDWIEGTRSAATRLLRSMPRVPLAARVVGTAVNDVGRDDAALIESPP